ncbi:BON domain-containing protein [Variovorax sp. HJSM1_2]|uniref:BON domain-containing protein n=1 Tax=Variovorax sp. HJSM1_2 TaxID=3366263 RepID=UPI003BE29381
MTKKFDLKRLSFGLLAVSALAASLSACVPLVVGGAAVGGVMVAADRRTSGAQLDDEGIELKAVNRIGDYFGDKVHVNVTSFNRQVLLTGEVPTAEQKERVLQIVNKVENVRSVVDETAVMASSSLSTRSSDTLVTGKVKATLVDAKDLQANSFKVVTERGTVYLMGRVTQREADRATQLVRTISGVSKVVRLFEIITEQELNTLQTTNKTAK